MCCHKVKSWTLQATQQSASNGHRPVPGSRTHDQIDWTLQATHHSTSQVQSFLGDIVARVQAMDIASDPTMFQKSASNRTVAQNNGTCHGYHILLYIILCVMVIIFLFIIFCV